MNPNGKPTMHTPLDSITLRKGAHPNRESGVCLMEAASWYAGEPHSDHPACVCPVLATFGRNLNDCMPDAERVRLLQYVPRVVGTAGDGHAAARGLMALDWLVRTYTRTWLALAGLDTEAAELRSLPEITSDADVQGSLDALGRARKRADAAWAAARDVARAAAGDAAWAAARDAALDAAWAAAWAAAGAAARAAAGDAAGAAAGAAAWDVARDAAWAAARDAAWDALTPTADALRASAVDLYARMIGLGSDDRPRYTQAVDEIVLEHVR